MNLVSGNVVNVWRGNNDKVQLSESEEGECESSSEYRSSGESESETDDALDTPLNLQSYSTYASKPYPLSLDKN